MEEKQDMYMMATWLQFHLPSAPLQHFAHWRCKYITLILLSNYEAGATIQVTVSYFFLPSLSFLFSLFCALLLFCVIFSSPVGAPLSPLLPTPLRGRFPSDPWQQVLLHESLGSCFSILWGQEKKASFPCVNYSSGKVLPKGTHMLSPLLPITDSRPLLTHSEPCHAQKGVLHIGQPSPCQHPFSEKRNY